MCIIQLVTKCTPIRLTILCRWSYLPLFFVVTPAHCKDGPLAIPMFAAVVLIYHFRVQGYLAVTQFVFR